MTQLSTLSSPHVATQMKSAEQVRAANFQGVEYVAHLDAESLLAYCASQLRSIDSQVKSLMANQNTIRSNIATINDAKRAINGAKELAAGDVEGKRRVAHALLEAALALPEGSAEQKAVFAQLDEFRSSAFHQDGAVQPADGSYSAEALQQEIQSSDAGNGHNKVTKEEMQHLNLALDSIASDMNRQAELQMINLQSVMSQRQMAVQMTTNLLSKLNDTLAAPIANMK